MPAKRDVIVNPFVSEFIYDAIVNATVEQRRFLNGKFLKVGRSMRKARSFSVNSTLEEKALMLTKLGIPFAWVFNVEKSKLKQLKEDAGEYTNVMLADKMLAEKYFVITDKQFMLFANQMASNCHSETWLLNRDFVQASYRLLEWRQTYGSLTLSTAKDTTVAAREMGKVMMNTIIFSKYAEGIFDINEAEIAVLLYFISKEREYITEVELKATFNGVYRHFKLIRAINTLVKSQYIEKGEGNKTKQFRITSWGIDTAMKFQKRVFSLENY